MKDGSDFTKLWLAGACSSLGDALGGTAYLFLALSVTHDAWFAGLFGGASLGMRALVKLPCGYLADRLPRRRLVVLAESLSGAVVVAFGMTVLVGWVDAAGLLIFALVAEVPYSLAQAALAGVTARVVTPNRLASAIARNQAGEAGASALGPLLGGVLFALGTAVPVLVDGVTFLVSALTLSRIRASLDAPRSEPRLARKDFWAGFRFIRSSPFLRFYLTWALSANMAVVAGFFTVIVTLRVHGASTTTTGLIISCAGAAGVLGSVTTTWVIARFSGGVLVPALSVAMLATGVGLALRPGDRLVVGALYSALCLVLPPAQTALSTRLVAEIPAAIQGRTFSAVGLLSELAVAPVLPAAGMLVHLIGVDTTLWSAAALLLVPVCVAFGGRRLAVAPV